MTSHFTGTTKNRRWLCYRWMVGQKNTNATISQTIPRQ